MIAWLKCLFMGHDWDVRHLDEQYEGERASWKDYQVCLRCGKDTRQMWEIEDDTRIRMERIEMEIRKRKL